MLRARLQFISPIDYLSWEDFAAAEHQTPWDEFGWFVLEIGLEGENGTTSFQALITTPAAVTRALGDDKQRRFLVVESFEPQALERALKDHVAAVAVHTWDGMIEHFRRNMYWEYEKRWS